jgi:hypothetical protein
MPDATKAAAAKARRDLQRARGLCTSCSVPTLPDRVRCRRHLAYFARDQKARRAASRGHGTDRSSRGLANASI